MKDKFISKIPLPKFKLWDKFKDADRKLVSFDLEITARCNNNCRHCYVNLSCQDSKAKSRELTLVQIKHIIDQAADLGALWCLITGGEPFLRKDFFDIYLYIKKKGLLVSVFTNATLINEKHIDFFKKYPPRDIEVTVYGVTKEVYERVTRIPGSFKAFRRGLDSLLKNKIPVRLKAMALRSNVKQLPQIARFCRQKTKDYFRFDPLLHLRFDRNQKRNEEIKSERLLPAEIVAIEKADSERSQALQKSCDKFIIPELSHTGCNHLFHCGSGNGSFYVSFDGYFKLCSSLNHPDCMYDLKKGSLEQAYNKFALKVRDMRSNNPEFLEKCRKCELVNLCLWCPAHAYLETGKLDTPVEYFCEVAHQRAEPLLNNRLK
ncbi:MAG: radical SAM protein [Candidatus Omnitrophica bacterium]|jgi:radical SAM protein with 4Fe4S-binding SPASM domain|nr:radical SAM protein [Candidatus Omnitrophota bacterium]